MLLRSKPCGLGRSADGDIWIHFTGVYRQDLGRGIKSSWCNVWRCSGYQQTMSRHLALGCCILCYRVQLHRLVRLRQWHHCRRVSEASHFPKHRKKLLLRSGKLSSIPSLMVWMMKKMLFSGVYFGTWPTPPTVLASCRLGQRFWRLCQAKGQ